jgi:predicted ester cyclase
MTVFWTAFPDVHDTIEHLIADGDKVVSRCTMRGTHQGEFMGMPPTGKEVSWTYMQMDRIEHGKFVESWVNVDDLGLLQQVGAIPQMAQGRA